MLSCTNTDTLSHAEALSGQPKHTHTHTHTVLTQTHVDTRTYTYTQCSPTHTHTHTHTYTYTKNNCVTYKHKYPDLQHKKQPYTDTHTVRGTTTEPLTLSDPQD